MDGWMDRCTNGQINEQMDGTVCKSADYQDEAVLGLNRGDADLAVGNLHYSTTAIVIFQTTPSHHVTQAV